MTARLSLHRALDAAESASVSTAEHLRFQLDHAQARDAVHTPLDRALLLQGLAARQLPALALHSAAPNRAAYLRRPDLGRTLHSDSAGELAESRRALAAAMAEHASPLAGVAIMLADGLSALALERNALPLLDALLAAAQARPLLPIVVATQARVALGDPIGEALGARLSLVLIGERPGLSAADSLGAYITWQPRVGRTDAERNCISNIREGGLGYTEAAARILHYLHEAVRLGTTGIALKDPSPTPPPLPRS
jgi:ethanolamine ammonia-lyase small subunit